MKLFENETLIKDFNKAYISVTNKRVRYEDSSSGNTKIVSMTLESVSSCGVVTNSSPLLIVFGIIAFLGIFIVKEDNMRVVLIAIAILLFTIYFFTRKAVISISSNGGDKISVPINNVKRGTIVEIVDTIEEQKIKNLRSNR